MQTQRRSVLVILATAAATAAVLLTDRHIHTVPNPGIISVVIVASASYVGGIAAGLIGSLIIVLGFALHFSQPDALMSFGADDLKRIMVMSAALPAVAVLVGLLHRRAERALQLERDAREAVEARNRELMVLRMALDEIDHGVVLLDHELRAEFLNQSFREMWRLPADIADSKPAFVGLMYHGRDSRAYDVPEGELDNYISARVHELQSGAEITRDIRMTDKTVLRFMCKLLAGGSRMLTYTNVTDIVRHADELETLQAALDHVSYGIMLLDRDLRVQFVNRVQRQIAQLPDELIETKPHYIELFYFAKGSGVWDIPLDDFEAYGDERLAIVRNGDPTPHDLRLSSGRILRSQCSVLPDGGRMLSYHDVTEIVQHAEQLERLATVDGMTGLYNRRHFLTLAEGEWARFLRYRRALCLILIDIDMFKAINDRFGHDVGDKVITNVAAVSRTSKRDADVVARLGGEEFAILLPETTLDQAVVAAERLRRAIASTPLMVEGKSVLVTISAGVAEAHVGMTGLPELMKRADEALYDAKRGGRNRVVRAVPVDADRTAWRANQAVSSARQ